MLVRDAPDLHVFMLRRSLRSTFVAGAYVFPGGAVDDGDAAPALLARCHGIAGEAADGMLGQPAALRYWVAAIRESFEEAGVLLAAGPARVSRSTSTSPVSPRGSTPTGARSWRASVSSSTSCAPTTRFSTRARCCPRLGGSRRWGVHAVTTRGSSSRPRPKVMCTSTTTTRPWRPCGCVPPTRWRALAPTRSTSSTRRSARCRCSPGSSDPPTCSPRSARAWRDDPQPMREVAPDQGWMLHLGGVPAEASGVDELEADALDHATFTVARPGGR